MLLQWFVLNCYGEAAVFCDCELLTCCRAVCTSGKSCTLLLVVTVFSDLLHRVASLSTWNEHRGQDAVLDIF